MLDRLRLNVREGLSPVAKKIVGVNPNTLTLLGLLISIAAAIFFAKGEVLAAGSLLLISGFFDVLDGAVARENGRTTRFGGFLDSVCDRFADAAILIGAMYGGLTSFPLFPGWFPGWFLGSLAIVGSFMVSYTRARAEAAGAAAAVGIGERAVRMVILILGAFLNLVNWAVLLVIVISFITVIQRIVFVRGTLK
ncbi:MAG: CDP-alcohol phosphatidyltransferase family protein [Candidatus Methanoperedens sp.]|nr:CDP-alcohol phosphatidyltransferase family protein [Candidatus Methanoperedens sp.]